MGKTIQFLALVCLQRAETRAPTLVVCPAATMRQWESEIVKYFGVGVLKVYLYHGKHKVTAPELMEYDIVITSYQTLECEYRAELNELKERCGFCAKLFLPELIRSHMKECGGGDDGNRRTGRGGDPRDYGISETELLETIFREEGGAPSQPEGGSWSTPSRSSLHNLLFGESPVGCERSSSSSTPILPELRRGHFVNAYDQASGVNASRVECSGDRGSPLHSTQSTDPIHDFRHQGTMMGRHEHVGVGTVGRDQHLIHDRHGVEGGPKSEEGQPGGDAQGRPLSWRHRLGSRGIGQGSRRYSRSKDEVEKEEWKTEEESSYIYCKQEGQGAGGFGVASGDCDVISISSDGEDRAAKEEEEEVWLDTEFVSYRDQEVIDLTDDVVEAEIVDDGELLTADYCEEKESPCGCDVKVENPILTPPGAPQKAESSCLSTAPKTPEGRARVKISSTKGKRRSPGSSCGSKRRRSVPASRSHAEGGQWRQPPDTFDVEDDIGEALGSGYSLSAHIQDVSGKLWTSG